MLKLECFFFNFSNKIHYIKTNIQLTQISPKSPQARRPVGFSSQLIVCVNFYVLNSFYNCKENKGGYLYGTYFGTCNRNFSGCYFPILNIFLFLKPNSWGVELIDVIQLVL